MSQPSMTDHRVVSRDAWLQERKALLAQEKEMTRLRDALSERRRALPWVRVEKPYFFDTPDGKKSLSDLFEGRSQLIVKHFMLAPGQKDGCVGCSFEVDHVEAALQHIENHDVKFVSVARAPLDEIEAFKTRMGWRFDWVSSGGSRLQLRLRRLVHARADARPARPFTIIRKTEVPLEDLSGFSVFYKNEDGEIFHTYSTFGRGAEEVLGSYMLLDLTPKGRNENGPNFNLTDWVRHHDRYGSDGHVAATGRWVAAERADCCRSN